MPRVKKPLTPSTPIFHAFLSLALSIFTFALQTSCHKSSPPPPTYPPPTPVPDTVAVAKKDTLVNLLTVEEIDSSRGPSPVHTNAFYRFYYDSNRRVTAVGIANFGGVLLDTGTCRLFYTGSQMKPSMIIEPILYSPPNGPANYDTTWFTYDAVGRPLMDSSSDHLSAYNPNTRQALTRRYSYLNTGATLINWYGEPTADGTPQLIRTDSVFALGYAYQYIRSLFYQRITFELTPTFTQANNWQFSNLINPLAKLNISGTPFSLIYSPVKRDLLGNSFTKAVLNSNIIPQYLDFASTYIPSSFFSAGFPLGSDFPIGSMPDIFDIRSVADSALPRYPKQISVGATTALDGRFIYKYTYGTTVVTIK